MTKGHTLISKMPPNVKKKIRFRIELTNSSGILYKTGLFAMSRAEGEWDG